MNLDFRGPVQYSIFIVPVLIQLRMYLLSNADPEVIRYDRAV